MMSIALGHDWDLCPKSAGPYKDPHRLEPSGCTGMPQIVEMEILNPANF